jgi:hypothetical protein
MKRLDKKQEDLLADLDRLIENHIHFTTTISLLKSCVTPHADIDNIKRSVLETIDLLEKENPNFNLKHEGH